MKHTIQNSNLRSIILLQERARTLLIIGDIVVWNKEKTERLTPKKKLNLILHTLGKTVFHANMPYLTSLSYLYQ